MTGATTGPRRFLELVEMSIEAGENVERLGTDVNVTAGPMIDRLEALSETDLLGSIAITQLIYRALLAELAVRHARKEDDSP